MTTPSVWSARSNSGSRFSASSTVHSTQPSTSTHRRTPGALGQPRHARRIELERDDLAEADLALQLARGAARQDAPGLDEGDLVAELVGLAHVVRRQHDRDPLLAAEPRDVGAHAHGDVGIETERGLVEEEELRLVDQRLGERDALLEPGRQVRIRDAAIRRRAHTARSASRHAGAGGDRSGRTGGRRTRRSRRPAGSTGTTAARSPC